MTIALPSDSRLYLEVPLRPAQGARFQPTGFPDLGAAEFKRPGDKDRTVVLVESAQSVANRMEEVCWDAAKETVVHELHGLPYVVVRKEADGPVLTSSILESHRLNSPYLLESSDTGFMQTLKNSLGGLETGRVDLRKLAEVVFHFDPNSLVHGLFLAKKELAGGRLRIPRMLTGFIEADDASPATSGGVKRDDVDPTGKALGTGANNGFGHVPFSRTEYTGLLRAYFAIDLAQLRAYALGDAPTQLLFALSLFKIHRFLRDGLRLRTACDLEVDGPIEVKRPSGYAVPTLAEVEAALPGLVAASKSAFASPAVTEAIYTIKKKAKGTGTDENASA